MSTLGTQLKSIAQAINEHFARKTDVNAKYTKPSSGIPKSDLASDVQTSLGKADTALQTAPVISVNTKTGAVTLSLSDLSEDSTHRTVTDTEKNTWNGKQNTTDNNLDTISKSITGAINEVNAVAKGANQAVAFSSYQAMVTAINAYAKSKYNVGQNIYIVTTEVPDLWVQSVENSSVSYTYVSDAAIISALQTDGYIQVGYFKLSMLETQKVDLTSYYTKTEVNTLVNAKYTKPSTGIPKTDLASDVQTSLGKADTALQSAPVTSVNGQTGAVSLSIPDDLADLNDDSTHRLVTDAEKTTWNAKASKPSQQSVSLTTSWTDDGDGYFSQTISVTGATNKSQIDVVLSKALLDQMKSDSATTIFATNNEATPPVIKIVSDKALTSAVTVYITREELS